MKVARPCQCQCERYAFAPQSHLVPASPSSEACHRHTVDDRRATLSKGEDDQDGIQQGIGPHKTLVFHDIFDPKLKIAVRVTVWAYIVRN